MFGQPLQNVYVPHEASFNFSGNSQGFCFPEQDFSQRPLSSQPILNFNPLFPNYQPTLFNGSANSENFNIFPSSQNQNWPTKSQGSANKGMSFDFRNVSNNSSSGLWFGSEQFAFPHGPTQTQIIQSKVNLTQQENISRANCCTPNSTLNPPKRNSVKLQNNLSKVAKFMQDAQSSVNLKKVTHEELDEDLLKDIPDSQSYVIYDKLWSSMQQRSMLLDQWKFLISKIEKEESEDFFSLPSSIVKGLFFLCQSIQTNFIIRFRALELYERYLRLFTEKMRDYLRKCTPKEYEDFFTRFQSQILLRMCSCILIASKLHSDTQVKVLTLEKIRNSLQSEGLVYSKINISRSELRVLETLNYKCHWPTPLDIIEQLLSILDLDVECLKRAHYFCILLLEYCYIDLDNIRDAFSCRVKKSELHTESNGKLTIPLQCAAVVSAALFIVSAEVKLNLHKVVAKRACQPEEDVNILAVIILDLLMVV